MKLYSNEIVFRGHPDKVCDQIAGAILNECLKQDPKTRAGIEVTGGKGQIFVTGELTTNAQFKLGEIVKRVLKDVGYPTDYLIIDNLGRQSHDIALGVDVGGAGDQGMMFGYACNDTLQKLPKAMVILQELAQKYDELRVKEPSVFYPDGKAQITGIYDKNFNLIKIHTLTFSYQNCEQKREYSDEIIRRLIEYTLQRYYIGCDQILINPTGRFKIGGFEGDAGVCGRKIVVDAYQSFANVGGGNMNGKDPTKVDFSAAHKAREIAKELLERFNLKWCEVQLSYAIGKEEPLAIYIDSNIGNIEPSDELYRQCTPRNIIKDLDLIHANYEDLAKYGHFR